MSDIDRLIVELAKKVKELPPTVEGLWEKVALLKVIVMAEDIKATPSQE